MVTPNQGQTQHGQAGNSRGTGNSSDDGGGGGGGTLFIHSRTCTKRTTNIVRRNV